MRNLPSNSCRFFKSPHFCCLSDFVNSVLQLMCLFCKPIICDFLYKVKTIKQKITVGMFTPSWNHMFTFISAHRCKAFLVCSVPISNNGNCFIYRLAFCHFYNSASFIIQKLRILVLHQINFMYKFRASKQIFNHNCKHILRKIVWEANGFAKNTCPMVAKVDQKILQGGPRK